MFVTLRELIIMIFWVSVHTAERSKYCENLLNANFSELIKTLYFPKNSQIYQEFK